MEPALLIKGQEEVTEEILKGMEIDKLHKIHEFSHWIWDIKKSNTISVELSDTRVVEIHENIVKEMESRKLIHASILPGAIEDIDLEEGRQEENQKEELDELEIRKYEVKFLKAIGDEEDEEAEEERIVYGVVLEPNTVDAQRDIISEEEIRLAAHMFLEKSQEIGVEHTDFKKSFSILESFVAPDNFIINKQNVKKGSWLLGVRVKSDETWEDVKSGDITGFSVAGKGVRTPIAA